MITLRDLVRTDTAIASITSEECQFIAKVLMFVYSLQQRWYLRWLIPDRLGDSSFQMRMIAAVLGRTRKEREPKVGEAIRLAMDMGRKAK